LIFDTVLEGNILSNGTCFTVGADDIVIDGAGYTVTSNGSGMGINNTGGYDNITIKDFGGINNFTNAVRLDGTARNNTIQNNTIIKSSLSAGLTEGGVHLTGDKETIVRGNTITAPAGSWGRGIQSDVGTLNAVIIENNITMISNTHGIFIEYNLNLVHNNTITTPGGGEGIVVNGAFPSGNNLTYNTITTSGAGIGIYWDNSRKSLAYRNTIVTTGSGAHGIRLERDTHLTTLSGNDITTTGSAYGVQLNGVRNATVFNNTINTSSHALYFSPFVGHTPDNNTFEANTLSSGGNDLHFSIAGVNGTRLIDQPITDYFFTGTGGTLSVEDTTYGKIKFLEPVSGSGSSFSDDVKIENTLITVDVVSNSGLDSSANLTFYGVPTNFAVPVMKRNSQECSSSICTNLTPLNKTTVIFNITGWTSYSIGDNVTSIEFSNAQINDTSTTPNGSIVNVSATITNTSPIDTARLQVDPPNEPPYNTSLALSGSLYYNNTITLNDTGLWIFTFYANDTAGLTATPVIANDLASNPYIDVQVFGMLSVSTSLGQHGCSAELDVHIECICCMCWCYRSNMRKRHRPCTIQPLRTHSRHKSEHHKRRHPILQRESEKPTDNFCNTYTRTTIQLQPHN